jgi:hypothetical protein
VTAYNFSGRGAKAALGAAFLALVETGRFQYWTDHPQPQTSKVSEDSPLSDAWWFFEQVKACAYELPPNGQFDRDLRWGVPAGHRTETPAGPAPTHDDRLISAALIAELDRRYRAGQIRLARALSAIVPGQDPLAGDVY